MASLLNGAGENGYISEEQSKIAASVKAENQDVAGEIASPPTHYLSFSLR